MRLFARSRAVDPPPPRPRARSARLGEISFPADAALAVSRDAALGLSVVANAVHEIVGIASQLSVDRLRGDEVLPPGSILTAPDPDVPWPTMIGDTIDDLVFYAEAFWLVLERDAEGFPSHARKLPWESVQTSLDPDYMKPSRIKGYAVGGQDILPAGVIRFRAPGRGILRDGARIILDALELQRAAARFAAVPLPAGVLTNEGQEIGDDDAREIVAGFDAARAAGSTAFLQSMRYERTQLNSADLQLIEAQAVADTRLARLLNVPIAMVGASPTGGASSQLYSNVVGSLAMLIFQTVSPYLRVVEETFSLAGVTPRGQRVAFNTGDWLRFAQVASPTPGLQIPVSPTGSEVQ